MEMNATYVWLNSEGMFEDKVYKFNEPTYNLFPNWKIHNKIMLVPILSFRDPFHRKENYRIVYCDLYHIINWERYLDKSNKRDEFITLINGNQKCEIVQTFEFYNNNFTDYFNYNYMMEEFKEHCSYINIQVSSNETKGSYQVKCYNNPYETLWITRYLFHRLSLMHNLILYFTEIALVNDELDELFNNLNISTNSGTHTHRENMTI